MLIKYCSFLFQENSKKSFSVYPEFVKPGIRVQIVMLIDAADVVVVKYKREADAGSLEHVNDDLAALRGLRTMALCCRRLFLQCVLARLLCRLLPHVPWCRALPRNITIGQCVEFLEISSNFW